MYQGKSCRGRWLLSLVLFQMQSVVLFCKSHRVLQNIGEGLSRDTERRSLFSPSYYYRRKHVLHWSVSPDEQQHRWGETNASVSEVLQFGTSSHEVEAPHWPQLVLQVVGKEITKEKQIRFKQRNKKNKEKKPYPTRWRTLVKNIQNLSCCLAGRTESGGGGRLREIDARLSAPLSTPTSSQSRSMSHRNYVPSSKLPTDELIKTY